MSLLAPIYFTYACTSHPHIQTKMMTNILKIQKVTETSKQWSEVRNDIESKTVANI